MLDSELIADLKASARKEGELYPVILGRFSDGHEEIISGSHRSAAGWKMKRVVDVKDRTDFLKKKLAATVQRRSSIEEYASLFSELCLEVKKSTNLQDEKVGREVLSQVTGFKKSFVYELIPDRYKRPKAPRAARESEDGTKDITFRTKEPGEEARKKIISCPNCGFSFPQ